jgi:pimeloyl-ACP methyl ester carboxylesterase
VLATDWWPQRLPDGTVVSLHTLIAGDGEITRGTLYTRGAGDTVFCLMHPRQDVQRHPIIPDLLDAGFAVWAQAGRDVNNDLRLIHEAAVLDVAAGMELLRERGFGDVVLIGISGGAGLYSLYAEQALAEPAKRIRRTPGGAPSGLPESTLPSPDGLALVAPHPGQGKLLLNMIDPSVADEADPLSVIDELDPYNVANGFGEAPEGSQFSEEFLRRYRDAQRARVAAIDERARTLIDDRQRAKRRWKDGSRDVRDRRASVMTPILVTYRTDADPRCTDRRLDANDRPYGSVISARPSISNYGVTGFGRLTTADSWLSTWSGLSSNNALTRSLEGVTVPTLVVEYTGDASVFPSDIRAALDALASTDVRHVRIRSDHFGRALAPDEGSGNAAMVRELLNWADGGRGR